MTGSGRTSASASAKDWEDLRAETDHIYAFGKEAGIGYKHNGQVGVDEVYTVLRDWYIQNGSLEIDLKKF